MYSGTHRLVQEFRGENAPDEQMIPMSGNNGDVESNIEESQHGQRAYRCIKGRIYGRRNLFDGVDVCREIMDGI